jgi:hypothetical protein
VLILDDSKENLTTRDAGARQREAMEFLAFNLERATRSAPLARLVFIS